MRKLLYIPILHTEPDLGSLGAALAQKSASIWGKERWDEHKKIAARFWANLTDYLTTLDASNLKIYQDGLPADGEAGRRIIEAAAKLRSPNHQLLLRLMERGAEVRKTEALALLQREYEYMAGLVQAKSVAGRIVATARYKLLKDYLTRRRDKFIAKTIAQTLKEGEMGLLFIGSYHNIFPHLPRDIHVHQLKERAKVNAYFQELGAKGGEGLKALAEYLVSPPAASTLSSSLN